MHVLSTIRHIDYTIIFARDMRRMRAFYEDTMHFAVDHELGTSWVAYKIGDTMLALTQPGQLFNDPPPAPGALSVQLAFRVERADVDRCAHELEAAGVEIELPPTDQPWGHRTVFFRDPDGNVLELFAELG